MCRVLIWACAISKKIRSNLNVIGLSLNQLEWTIEKKYPVNLVLKHLKLKLDFSSELVFALSDACYRSVSPSQAPHPSPPPNNNSLSNLSNFILNLGKDDISLKSKFQHLYRHKFTQSALSKNTGWGINSCSKTLSLTTVTHQVQGSNPTQSQSYKINPKGQERPILGKNVCTSVQSITSASYQPMARGATFPGVNIMNQKNTSRKPPPGRISLNNN